MPLKRSIKIDDEVYEKLQQLAKELGVDSPNQVLRKLLLEQKADVRFLPMSGNGFAREFYGCLSSVSSIDFVSVISCASWARALQELGERPILITVDVRSYAYEVAVVKDLENPIVYVYRMDGRIHDPEKFEISLCGLLGLLLAVREDIESGGRYLLEHGYRCKQGSYGEYLTYTCFQEDSLGYRYVLLMIRRDAFNAIPRIESYLDIDGYRVRRVLTSFCYTFVGPLPIQRVPQVLYIVGLPSWLRIGVSLCNAWNGTVAGDMFIEIELDESKLEAVYNVLAEIFGKRCVRKRRKSIKVESYVHVAATQLGIELGELRRLEDLNTVLNNIDKLVTTILKQVFSCIRVAPSKRRA